MPPQSPRTSVLNNYVGGSKWSCRYNILKISRDTYFQWVSDKYASNPRYRNCPSIFLLCNVGKSPENAKKSIRLKKGLQANFVFFYSSRKEAFAVFVLKHDFESLHRRKQNPKYCTEVIFIIKSHNSNIYINQYKWNEL